MLPELASTPVGDPVTVTPLAHNAGNQATGGIWRVDGTDGTAILKHATPSGEGPSHWAASDDPEHWNFWRREILAYETGFVTRYCADTGLSAPALLETSSLEDGSRLLWLEYIDGAPGARWTVGRLAAFARQLGRAQARWADRDRPHPWLSRRWLRGYVTKEPVPEPVPWHHPAVARLWDRPLREGVEALWRNRNRLITLAESLPRTVCHLDVWPMNLIARGDTSMLLDWSFVGDGAIGEDIGNLIPDTVADGLFDTDLLPDIVDATIKSYIDGLSDGGWTGSPSTVHRAVAITAATKYPWLAPLMIRRLAEGVAVGSANYDADSDTQQVFARRAVMLNLLCDWARRALDAP